MLNTRMVCAAMVGCMTIIKWTCNRLWCVQASRDATLAAQPWRQAWRLPGALCLPSASFLHLRRPRTKGIGNMQQYFCLCTFSLWLTSQCLWFQTYVMSGCGQFPDGYGKTHVVIMSSEHMRIWMWTIGTCLCRTQVWGQRALFRSDKFVHTWTPCSK